MSEKYKNGKIYKISCNVTGEYYVGSTIQTLERRLDKHISTYKCKKNGILTVFKILDGNDFKIELIENVECDNKEQLLEKERYHILNTDCVNKVVPIITREERKEKNKEYNKAYRVINKERDMEYYKLKSAKRYATKIICECGIETSLSNKARHEKTKHHLSFIK